MKCGVDSCSFNHFSLDATRFTNALDLDTIYKILCNVHTHTRTHLLCLSHTYARRHTHSTHSHSTHKPARSVRTYSNTYITYEHTISYFVSSAGVCIARSLKIPREVKPDTFANIMLELLEYSRARVVVLFVNEDNCRRLIAASVKLNRTNAFIWLASDSWGAKIVPVDRQEWAAEGAITILPQRKVVKGMYTFRN